MTPETWVTDVLEGRDGEIAFLPPVVIVHNGKSDFVPVECLCIESAGNPAEHAKNADL